MAWPCSVGRKRICPCKVSLWWLSAYLGHQFKKEKEVVKVMLFLVNFKGSLSLPPLYILLSGELTVCSCWQRLCPLASNLPPHAHKIAAGDREAGVGGRGQDALAIPLTPPAVLRRPASQLTPARLQLLRMMPQISVRRVLGLCGKPVSDPPLLDPHVPTPAQQKGLAQLTFTKAQRTRGEERGGPAGAVQGAGVGHDSVTTGH